MPYPIRTALAVAAYAYWVPAQRARKSMNNGDEMYAAQLATTLDSIGRKTAFPQVAQRCRDAVADLAPFDYSQPMESDLV